MPQHLQHSYCTKMEKITTAFLWSIIPSTYFIWTEQMGCAITTLVIAFLADLLMGMYRAIKEKRFSSKCAIHKTYHKIKKYLILALFGYILTIGVGRYWTILSDSFIWICVFFSAIEMLSVTEHLAKVGYTVPNKIIKAINSNLDKYK